MSKQLFPKKRNNNGMIWASVIGLIVSAAAYFVRRNPGTNGPNNNTIQNLMNSFTSAKTNSPIPNAMMAEFAKELLPENPNNQTNK
ncbi:hypothetical protein [Bacillus sp. S/N-304-OC-R1]|uniref:hypothetical protein n=1 Tax=Bacillus sp. S/N-304-OC-R1 TaxID=2758034 RepID=UPI001C8EF3B1|nr:hypothetical protein [Bacillus sp. S/N-304-OC-R1]MBY0120474.1 hypothetical protein [Bacillus sp. S/N-304-OC-R1]